MANLVTGAMGSLIPKLGELLKEEYNLQAGVKERISSLTQELELAQAALCKVAEVPWDQLDKQVQIWARKVQEASYDMEDVLDTFLVRVEGPESTDEENNLLKHIKKLIYFFKRSKARRKISGDVKNIMTHLQEVTEQCRRYKVEDIGTRTATTTSVDPRLHAMYTQVNKLVGVDKSSGELMSKLQLHDTKMKKVSIVGVGGLGKTTLAKVVYDKIKGDFSCTAFVAVGRNPDLKKIFKDILIDLDRQKYLYISTAELDEKQFIDELRNFLGNEKRFLIVIDDIWEIETWEQIKLAMDDDKNCGDRIIITTRKSEVATKVHDVYKLQPLPVESSRELLYARINGHQGGQVDSELDEISDKFIRKCGGIPLAIITMASLLAGKPRDKWSELYSTIDFGSKDDKEAEKTMRILSFSYNDMPSHLRTCLLYLSASMEDSVIDKGSLVWKWVAEGFVLQKKGISLFETGESYFNDLINRSMIQAVESKVDDNIIIGCRVHDMVLDFIRSMSEDENFFTVVDTNNLDTQPQSNVRRLANHRITIGQTHETNSHLEMPKLRSFIALWCDIDTWAPPLSSFTLLRVLALENCSRRVGCVQVEHIVHLLHLRFLSLRGTHIDKIPEDIGALRFLQTLDLWGSLLSSDYTPVELPSSCCFLKQLLCLRMRFGLRGVKVFSLEGMTSLEELVITAHMEKPRWQILKDLACLTELRVLELEADIRHDDEIRVLAESLRHLHKLQSLNLRHNTISSPHSFLVPIMHQAKLPEMTELPCQLHHFSSSVIIFSKISSCINPRRLLNLTHLDLVLKHLDDEDLKTLGELPELHFLSLNLMDLSRPATIHNISDRDACYFPKLRCFRLYYSVLSFVTNKDDKRVSFHIWEGYCSSATKRFNDELDRARPSVSDDEFKRDDEMQSPMPSISHDDELQRPHKRSKLHQGLAAVAYYLVALCLHVLAYIKIWTLKQMDQHPLPSVSDDENKGSTISSAGAAAAAPRFMPSLQVLHLDMYFIGGIPNWFYNLGWEHLSSLREIHVDLIGDSKNKLENMLRRAAEDHPNHPTLHISKREGINVHPIQKKGSNSSRLAEQQHP